MRLAVWNESALDVFVRGIEALKDQLNLDVVRADRRKCRDLLVLGEVDVALLPTLSVFTESDLFDVLPAVAVSSWDFPFLKLYLKQGLDAPINSVAINPFYAQEALVARIILKEHYDKTPSFHPYPEGSDVLRSTSDDAALVMSSTLEEQSGGDVALDLGRDWYELTHYPMVWGLFTTRRGEAESSYVKKLRETAHFTEIFKDRWLDESNYSPALDAFYREGIRYRLDDMAIASLTALQDFLYYTNVVDEIDPLVFYQVDEAIEDEEDQPLL